MPTIQINPVPSLTKRKSKSKKPSVPTYDRLEVIHPNKESWYTVHRIAKRSGGVRIIEAPTDWLKAKQTEIYETILLKRCGVHAKAFGCIKNRSIKQASDMHVQEGEGHTVLKLDLKDCFHSINEAMIRESLSFYGISPSVISKILTLCTNSRGVLPQGSPASASLANIVMTKMYAALDSAAANVGLVFSGYLDDLVFSGVNAAKFSRTAISIIYRYKFRVAHSKTVVMRRKREVLGLCVAKGKPHARLPKYKRNRLRGLLHSLEKKVQSRIRDWKLLRRVEGLVAFACMAGDQKAEVFKEKVKKIRLEYGSKNT